MDLTALMPGFFKRRQEDLAQLNEALATRDLTVFKYIGHKVKGNAGMFGFAPLGEIGARIEAAAALGDFPELAQAVKAFEQELKKILEYQPA